MTGAAGQGLGAGARRPGAGGAEEARALVRYRMSERRARAECAELARCLRAQGGGGIVADGRAEEAEMHGRHVAEADARIRAAAAGSPDASLLMTVPGVGPVAALAVAAESGGAAGFPDPSKFVAYLGMAPPPAGGPRGASVRRQELRRVLIAAARTNARLEPGGAVAALRGRMVGAGKGEAKADAAAGAKLARIMYHMMAEGRAYDPGRGAGGPERPADGF